MNSVGRKEQWSPLSVGKEQRGKNSLQKCLVTARDISQRWSKKKYFIITDVHSFYDEMVKALSKAGFDRDNPEHILVHCGDLFDRGPKPKECLDYIMSIPKERRILIMGNHEERLLQILDGWRCPDESDYHNKTMDTIIKFADAGTPRGVFSNKKTN